MPSLLMMFSGVCINRLIILYTWGNSWFPMDFPSNPSSDTTQCVFLTVAIHFGNLYQTALLLARLQWVLTLLVCIDSSTGEWQVNGWFLQIWRVVYWIYETGKHLYVCSNRPFTMNGNFIVYTCIHIYIQHIYIYYIYTVYILLYYIILYIYYQKKHVNMGMGKWPLVIRMSRWTLITTSSFQCANQSERLD